jgi:hypothetical protein
VEIDPDAPGLLRVEVPAVVRLGGRVGQGHRHLHRPVVESTDPSHLVLVGGVDVHLAGEEKVVALHRVGDVVATVLQASGEELAVQGVPLRRQRLHRIFDDLVRQA